DLPHGHLYTLGYCWGCLSPLPWGLDGPTSLWTRMGWPNRIPHCSMGLDRSRTSSHTSDRSTAFASQIRDTSRIRINSMRRPSDHSSYSHSNYRAGWRIYYRSICIMECAVRNSFNDMDIFQESMNIQQIK